MAFIKPMHCDKMNIAYLLTYILKRIVWWIPQIFEDITYLKFELDKLATNVF